MALYDMYEQYRDPRFSEAEQQEIDKAEIPALRMEVDPSLERRPGGFWSEREGFMVHPVVGAKIMIARKRAEAQFDDRIVMPEDSEVGIRFPGVDPLGKYSAIDMKFAQREAAIRATLESRSPEVQAYAKSLLDKCTSTRIADREFSQRRFSMQQFAKAHRTLTRASKLCPDPDGRRLLHQQARNLETDTPVEQYDKLMQGIEYAAGVRQGPVPQEIIDFYKQTLKTELDLGVVAAARSREQMPAEIHVEFQDLDNKLLQRAFADPHNWGKSSLEIAQAADALDMDAISGVIPPYAAATADRAIDPLFRDMERDAPAAFQDPAAEKAGFGLDIEFSRGDLISVDGKTIRETMQEQFAASGRQGKFEDFYRQNVRQMTGELVAAGLMAGKRVEAFVPDKYGRLPKEPTQITKTGYEPTPLKPERFNAWQRHFAKRGFYKNKVARQQEYERVMAARERMKAKAMTSEQARRQDRTEMLRRAADSSTALRTENNKELFFGQLMGEEGLRTFTTTPEGRTEALYDWDKLNAQMSSFHAQSNLPEHVEPIEACVMGLMAQGHRYADIMDPDKLQDERRDMAREVFARSRTNDQEWLGQIHYRGMKAALQQLGEMTRGIDMTDQDQLLRVLPWAETLANSALNASLNISDDKCRLGFYKAAMEDAGGDPVKGSELADQLYGKIQDVAVSTQTLSLGIQGQLKLIDPQANIPQANMINNSYSALCYCAVGAATMDTMKPGSSIVDSVPPTEVIFAIQRHVAISKQFKDLSADLEKAPQQHRAAVARQAAAGRLTGELFHPSVQLTTSTMKDQADVLTRAEDGTFSLRSKAVERPLCEAKISFAPDKELAGPEKAGPQVQAKQKAAPQKKPPQMGGPKR